LKDIWEKVGVGDNVSVHVDSVGDGWVGGEGGEEFKFLGVQNLKVPGSEGADIHSEIWEGGGSSEAGDSLGSEESEGGCIGADYTEFPRDLEGPELHDKVKS